LAVVAERVDFLSSRPREESGDAEASEQRPVVATNGKAAVTAGRKS
jgi:hypothetical protein